MKKSIDKKQYLLFAVVYAAIFAIYNIIVMLLFSGKNHIFWISYGFMCASFAANIFVTIYSFKKLDAEAVFLGIPLLYFSIFYFLGELFMSFVFMLFRNHASTKLTLALQVIFLLIFVIFSAFAMMSRNIVSEINETVDKNAKNIKMLSGEVKLLEDQCLDKELKAELHNVQQAIHYSDAMSNEYVAELDELIHNSVRELKYMCNNNNKSEAMQICVKLESYINERKVKLINSK